MSHGVLRLTLLKVIGNAPHPGSYFTTTSERVACAIRLRPSAGGSPASSSIGQAEEGAIATLRTGHRCLNQLPAD